ncbi:PTS fructose transporter subunit IIB [Halalkalicoccus subterraneus]|uniref:PTS fructose transporter subunit IIB n=1 Tax=Halalkalicoccus subterraneus TaxID=2675002 RepID=UPI000EFC8B42|nr:PTS fructose transporter subunit IIB [Halalkalicoccus subterraneus]
MKLVAITSCPTGIAHSQMAAENLEQTADKLGHEIRVEIQGAMGAEDELSSDEIVAADAVIIASDTSVNRDRFTEKTVVKGTVKDAVNDAESLIEEAVERAGGSSDPAESVATGGEPAAGDDGDEQQRRGGDPEKGLFKRLKRLFS